MVETPEQRVARLQAELARAKVEALEAELAAARAGAATPPVDPEASSWTSQQTDPALTRALQYSGVQFGKTPPPDTNLAPAPRAVPAAYRIMLLPFSWWTLFTLFMIAVAPIAVWIFAPLAGVIVAAVTFALVLLRSVRKAVARHALLKWGEVANVVNPEVLSVGTYYSGTTVQNVRIAQAHGWTVERRWYSGPVTKTRVEYLLHGRRGHLTIRGLPYDNGVILADSRNPDRALCISSFPYDLNRDASGNWTGEVASRVKVGAFLMLDLLIAWTAGMIIICGLGAGLW